LQASIQFYGAISRFNVSRQLSILHLGRGVLHLACYMESGGKFRNSPLAQSLALGKIHPGRGVILFLVSKSPKARISAMKQVLTEYPGEISLITSITSFRCPYQASSEVFGIFNSWLLLILLPFSTACMWAEWGCHTLTHVFIKMQHMAETDSPRLQSTPAALVWIARLVCKALTALVPMQGRGKVEITAPCEGRGG